MSVPFAKYDETGRILCRGRIPENAVTVQGANTYIGEADPALHWIHPVTGVRGNRTAMTPAVTTAPGQATINGLPPNCTATVNGEQATFTDGTLTLTVDVPGTYTVRLRARPRYLDHELEVTIP
jgi:hypothetical protein